MGWTKSLYGRESKDKRRRLAHRRRQLVVDRRRSRYALKRLRREAADAAR